MSNVTVPFNTDATLTMRVDRADGRPPLFYKQVDGVEVEIDQAEYEQLNAGTDD